MKKLKSILLTFLILSCASTATAMDQCSLCSFDLDSNFEDLTTFPFCGHAFHKTCFDAEQCPICPILAAESDEDFVRQLDAIEARPDKDMFHNVLEQLLIQKDQAIEAELAALQAEVSEDIS